ncbi:hypothetical protein ACIA5D_14495 [Actinoplanes sp. NPDC051513]|uniref:hypothetical protein n=1 Tax=Actinoplanes sp. NPDC051513 TaxID=3363908 RepID=UPI0037A3DE93
MRWAVPLLAMAGAGAVSVWGALYTLPWVTAGGCIGLLAVLAVHLAVNEREAPSWLRVTLGAALVLLAGAMLVKVSGWLPGEATLNVPRLTVLAENLRAAFQREATVAGFQFLAWACLAVVTGWLLGRRPPFGVGALAIVAGMAMLAGAATGEAQYAGDRWRGWQALSADLAGSDVLSGLSATVAGPPYVGTGTQVGAALLGTTLTVLACARLGATSATLGPGDEV